MFFLPHHPTGTIAKNKVANEKTKNDQSRGLLCGLLQGTLFSLNEERESFYEAFVGEFV